MAEEYLGQVTVSDSNGRQASGSGAKDGSTIDVQLGNVGWIRNGGNYTLQAGASSWQAMNTSGPDGSGYYSFQAY